MSGLRDLVLEYDALVDEVAGFPVETEPPASAAELRAAERVLGCELHPDQVVYRSIHRSGHYPGVGSLAPLPHRRSDLVFVPGFEIAPFDPRRTLTVDVDVTVFSPQDGPRAGHVIQLEAPDPTPVLLGTGLEELFSSWVAYIRAGVLVWDAPLGMFLVPSQRVSDGLEVRRRVAREDEQRAHDLAGSGVRPAAIGLPWNLNDGRSLDEWYRATAAEAGYDFDELDDIDWDSFDESEARFSEWQAADPLP